jgi:hypothetical protein
LKTSDFSQDQFLQLTAARLQVEDLQLIAKEEEEDEDEEEDIDNEEEQEQHQEQEEEWSPEFPYEGPQIYDFNSLACVIIGCAQSLKKLAIRCLNPEHLLVLKRDPGSRRRVQATRDDNLVVRTSLDVY